MILKEKIKMAIDRSKDAISSTLDDWSNIVPEKKPSVYYSLGLYTFNIAIYNFLLSDRNQALVCLKKSAGYYRDSINGYRALYGTGTWMNEAGICTDLLNVAILSGDREIMIGVASTALSIDEKFIKKYTRLAPHYYYVKALGYMLTGDDDRAVQIVDQMSAKPKHPFEDYFIGLSTCLSGCIAGEKNKVVGGLDILLKYHNNRFGKNTSTVADELICVPATVQISLAKIRGIQIEADDLEESYRRYVTWNLFE